MSRNSALTKASTEIKIQKDDTSEVQKLAKKTFFGLKKPSFMGKSIT